MQSFWYISKIKTAKTFQFYVELFKIQQLQKLLPNFQLHFQDRIWLDRE